MFVCFPEKKKSDSDDLLTECISLELQYDSKSFHFFQRSSLRIDINEPSFLCTQTVDAYRELSYVALYSLHHEPLNIIVVDANPFWTQRMPLLTDEQLRAVLS